MNTELRDKRRKAQRLDALKGTLQRLEGILEVVLLMLVYYYIWRNTYWKQAWQLHDYGGMGKYVLIGLYGLIVFVLFFLCDSFQFSRLKPSEVIISQGIVLFIANFITYFQLSLISNKLLPVLPMCMILALDLAVAIVCVYSFVWIYRRIYRPRNMLLVYGTENAETLLAKMNARKEKYNIAAAVHEDAGLAEICRTMADYEAVVINDIRPELRNKLLKFCYEQDVRVYLVPKISDIIIRSADDLTLFDTPLCLVRTGGLTPAQRFFKRAMDILLCLIALIPAAPIMLIVAAAIKLEDHGPVFYRQTRVTRGGKPFEILKFRSMIVDAEKDGRSIPATERDPRITKVGNIIRPCRVDELPQLLNILKGDMSIVGPRPERVEHYEEYGAVIPEFSYRTKVKGGLTGYAQIYGKYNTSAYDKVRLDLIYIQNYSLMMDIKLIFMTLQILLKKESTEGFSAAPEGKAENREEQAEPSQPVG